MANSLLPQNQTALEAAIADATESAVSPDGIAKLWDAEICPAGLLPWLAWALSVDDWDETWDEATQRRVIAASIDIHRKKGTVGAVLKALTSLGHEGRLVEWWQTEPQGTPHTFHAEVDISNRGIDATAIAAIRRQIDAAKPVRSHYDLELIAHSDLTSHAAVFCLYGQLIEIQPYQITELTSPDVAACSAISVHVTQSITIYPLE